MIGSDACPALCPDWVISAVLAVFCNYYLQGDTHQLEWVGLQEMENLQSILCKVYLDYQRKVLWWGWGWAQG